MAVPTQCQRGIWELPAAALRGWHPAPPTGELSPWCHAAHPHPPRAVEHRGTGRCSSLASPRLPWGTRRCPHQRCDGPAGECWHASSCALPSREASRSATHGFPTGCTFGGRVAGCRFPQCCPAAAGWAGGRGGTSSPKLVPCGEGRDGCQESGDRPQMLLCFHCAPHTWVQCLVWGRAACGAHPPLYLQGPGAVFAGRLAACYLCPGPLKAQSKCSPTGRPGGDGSAGAGHVS